MQPAYIDDTDRKVKDALNVWANAPDSVDVEGYPTHSIGLIGGGGAWGGFIEDEEEAEKVRITEAIDAIMEDMPQSQCDAIFHFHCAAVFKPRRTRIEDDYMDALIPITIGLRKRDLI